MTTTRWYHWDGAVNARDLGGLPLEKGGETRFGRVIRSGSTSYLSGAGWDAAQRDGVTTVVDLRHDGERADDTAPRPPGVTTLATNLEDDQRDTAFWDVWGGGISATPLFFAPFLEHDPAKVAETMAAIADADPDGALVVHCSAGRDRTGLVVLLLLALAGVEPQAIVDDYELTDAALAPVWIGLGRDDEAPGITAKLAERGETRASVLRDVLERFDPEHYLRDAGLSAEQIGRLRARLTA